MLPWLTLAVLADKYRRFYLLNCWDFLTHNWDVIKALSFKQFPPPLLLCFIRSREKKETQSNIYISADKDKSHSRERELKQKKETSSTLSMYRANKVPFIEVSFSDAHKMTAYPQTQRAGQQKQRRAEGLVQLYCAVPGLGLRTKTVIAIRLQRPVVVVFSSIYSVWQDNCIPICCCHACSCNWGEKAAK